MKKNVVWQNFDIDMDAWREDYKDCHMLSDEDMEEIDDETIFGWGTCMNDRYLDDERCNLNIQLDDDIVVLGDVGRWYGRISGYKIIQSGNIKDCLSDEDCQYCEWYCDDDDFRFTGAHHDGRNYYLYRTWADGVTDEEKEKFLDDVYVCGVVSKDLVQKYTKSLRPYIAKVYGW